VRDLALGRPVHDLDVAVDVDAARFARAVAARLEAARPAEPAEVVTEARFGTASVRSGRVALDLARLRSPSRAASRPTWRAATSA